MIAIGVDPGQHGAIAAITPTGAQAWPMPVLPTPAGERRFAGYDRPAVAQRFAPLAIRPPGTPPAFCVVESVRGLPAMGMQFATIYWLGAGPWYFAGLCDALRIQCRFVDPREWQNALLGLPPPKRGEDRKARRKEIKARSIAVATRLFPGFTAQLGVKGSDGLADALLLAEYAHRLASGGELFARASA
jgi:hypothetical protein